jgi:hypothetical protein
MKRINIKYIAVLLLSLTITVSAATYPVIFIQGIGGAAQGHATPSWAWREWNGERTQPPWLYHSPMNKILEENYGGYTAGTPLDCDINSSLSSTGGETRKIYNFSYYQGRTRVIFLTGSIRMRSKFIQKESVQ